MRSAGFICIILSLAQLLAVPELLKQPGQFPKLLCATVNNALLLSMGNQLYMSEVADAPEQWTCSISFPPFIMAHLHVHVSGFNGDTSHSLWMGWRYALPNWIVVLLLALLQLRVPVCARKPKSNGVYANIPAQAIANQITVMQIFRESSQLVKK